MMTDYAKLYAGLLSESDPRTIPKRQDKGPITQYHAEDLLRAPYDLLESGEVRLSLYYPAAKKVEIEGHMFVCELHIDGDYHTGTCRVPPGFHPLKVFVDGSEVLDRYLPIGYGHGRPINYLSIPSGDDPRAVAEKERGSVEMVWLDSKIAGGYQRLFVYLPAQYHREPERRFPVLYLQHGHGENETAWFVNGRVHLLLDELFASGEAEPAIVVMSNGMTASLQGDSAVIHAFDGFIRMLTEEIVPFTDGRFRTISDREHRAVAGLSLGSIQASLAARKRPDLFVDVGLFSGFFRNPSIPPELIPAGELCAFREKNHLLFRAIGTEDKYMAFFEADDRFLMEEGIPSVRKLYPGMHEWNVWRLCLRDFMQLVFH